MTTHKIVEELISKTDLSLLNIPICSEAVDTQKFIIDQYKTLARRLVCLINQRDSKVENHEKRITKLEHDVEELKVNNRLLMTQKEQYDKMMSYLRIVSNQLPLVEDAKFAAIDSNCAVVFFTNLQTSSEFFDVTKEEILQILASNKSVQVDGQTYKFLRISQI